MFTPISDDCLGNSRECLRPVICELLGDYHPNRMQEEKTAINYPQKIARIILKVILFLILFIVVVFLLLLTPPVQKFATTKVENFLENKLQTKVEIGRISINLPRKVALENVYIEDRSKDTLLSGGSIKANIELFELLSNRVEVKSIELTDITAKIKRLLPDTTFNFQFIVDAFAPAQTTPVDTTAAGMEMNIDDVVLNNVRVIYQDVVTGNDMVTQVDHLDAAIDTFNINTPHYDIATLNVKGLETVFKQAKPLAPVEPNAQAMSDAAEPIPLKLNVGKVDLDDVQVDYSNALSSLYTKFNIDHLVLDGRRLDLQNNVVHLDELRLDNTSSAIRIGKAETAELIKDEVTQEVAAQQQNNWTIRADRLRINNNTIQFDNDNERALNYGMDYAHLKADDLTLHIDNVVFNADSIGGLITRGEMKEKSGFVLNSLQADLLYASNQSYIKNLYLKTPGTELRRDLILEYASYDALINNFERTVMDVDIANSYVQVKDILTFAPQLRGNPAFSRPNEVWRMNIKGSGSMERLYVEALQFSGLSNTVIDASGTLTSITDPNAAGGNFNIRRFHTTKSDIKLFAGNALPEDVLNLPQSIDMRGTLAGNMRNLAADLHINSSAGFVSINGRFGNLANPAATTYNASIRTTGLQLGSILRNPQLGSVSAAVTANGRGFTPDAINTTFRGQVYSLGFNNYTYRNIAMNGSLNKTVFNADINAADPNAFFEISARGNFSETPSFVVNGFVDSVKTLPLNFTAQPLVFRGKIDANIPNADPNNLQADVLITDALFVSGKERLPLDSLTFVATKTDTGQYISLASEIANAKLTGQFQLTDLGNIIINNIQPYFSINSSASLAKVKPYDIHFTADVVYSPILGAFVPGLTTMEPLHAEGSLATGQGMQAKVRSDAITLNGNQISNLAVNVNTADSGMQILGTVAHIKSAGALDLYNTRIHATALNNNVNFNLRVGDRADADKYLLTGLFTQPSPGNMQIRLQGDSLMLNYQRWTVTPDNAITITPEQILANNFVLQYGNQKLALNSASGSGIRPLNVAFTDFQLGTITGFIQDDTLLVDGTLNGSATFKNLLQQPVFTSDLTINNLSFKEDTVGNVALQVSTAGTRYNANAQISGFGNNITLTGSFEPQGADIALDLEMAINRLELSTLEGVMSDFVTQASGGINGNVSINGTSSAPKIQGALNFDSASVSTTVLGGPLTINNEKINVTEEGFGFDNFTIRDSANNTLNLNGAVTTTNFINYGFNLDVVAENFRAVSTTQKESDIYFGDLVISTDMHISGTESAPVVEGSLTVNDGTRFSVVIPQPKPGLVEREGVVEFVDFDSPLNDSLFMAAYDSLNTSSLVGFDITTNIEIQKEAIFNIVIDAANGDFLNIRGTGQVSAGIDPSGKITMAGNYEIEEGAYQFSLNFLQRRFDIEKGSKIIWMGEPTDAQVDVKAVYIANTAPLDLVEDQIDDARRNFYRQKLPFQIVLNLDGELMKPIITFDVLLPEDQNYSVGSDVITLVNNRLMQLRQEPSELTKQVFAVLLLNRFVGANPFAGSDGGGFSPGSLARQSVSKLLTEQLNNLAGGLIGGVDIQFGITSSAEDYSTGVEQNRTDLNVGLSKRLLNDRLTVSVGNDFQLEGNRPANSAANNVAGNVSVNYQLSKDGRYMLRFFRNNEYEASLQGYVIETGLGFIMTVDYNSFRQLIRGRRQRPGGQREENNQKEEQ